MLGVWIVVLVVVTALSQMIGSAYEDKFSGGHSESQQVQDLLAERFPARAGDTAEVVFRTSPDPVTTPANQQAIENVVAKVKAASPTSSTW